jgi:hypothetical protein
MAGPSIAGWACTNGNVSSVSPTRPITSFVGFIFGVVVTIVGVTLALLSLLYANNGNGNGNGKAKKS